MNTTKNSNHSNHTNIPLCAECNERSTELYGLGSADSPSRAVVICGDCLRMTGPLKTPTDTESWRLARAAAAQHA